MLKRIAVAPWDLRVAADDTITHTLCVSFYCALMVELNSLDLWYDVFEEAVPSFLCALR